MEKRVRQSKWLLHAAAVVLLLMIIFGGYAAASTLSREEIRVKMYMHIKEVLGYDQNELIEGTLDKFQETWLFSVTIKDHSATNDGIITGSMDGNGALLSIKEPFELDLEMQLVSSFDAHVNSMEGMYAFMQEWLPQKQALLKALGQVNGTESDSGFLAIAARLISEIGLPGQGDISREDALAKAKARIIALLGWPREKLDYFVVMGEAYLTAQDIGKPVYQFIFSGRKMTAEEMNGGAAGKAFEKYLKELYAAFGGAQNVPKYITIRIDAKTGNEVEEPWILYPEDLAYYDYRDLFVR